MSGKDIRKAVFHKLLSPPCPNCQSYDIKPLGNRPPMLHGLDDLAKSILVKRKWIVECFECNNCGTRFDRAGNSIVATRTGK